MVGKTKAARWGFLAPAAALLGLGGGCGDANTYVEPPPPEVTVATPVQRDVTTYFEATGNTQPVLTVEVRARVRGFLKEQLFQEGALVKKGDLLLVIDEEPFQVALEQAKAKLDEAEAALRKAKESKAPQMARAQLELDKAELRLARLNEERSRSLIGRGAGTREEMDQTEAARKKAEAQVESDIAALEQAEADYETGILAATAAVATARQAVRNAEIELGYCRMHAPIDGRISRINHHVGNLVGDGQATLLTTIVSTDPIHAYSTINEYDLLRFRRETGGEGLSAPIEMALAGEEGFPHKGTIDYQDPTLDTDTGTVQVRGVFPNEDGAILPGLFVRVRVPSGTQTGAILVPERALGSDQAGRFLLVVDKDDVVQHRPVQTGQLVDGLRVVEGDIGVEDRIVVDGLLRARPNLKVQPIAADAPEGQEAIAAAIPAGG